jgi:hypothetical protein
LGGIGFYDLAALLAHVIDRPTDELGDEACATSLLGGVKADDGPDRFVVQPLENGGAVE